MLDKCPLFRQFLKKLPPQLYKEVTKPHPYYIRLKDGRVYVTSMAETAGIDLDMRSIKRHIITRTAQPKVYIARSLV